MGEYYLGVDGGGTKTKFALADENRKILRELTLGASNPVDVGFEKCFAVLKEGIDGVCGGIPFSSVRTFVGVAGGVTGDSKERISEFLSGFGFKSYSNGSDCENIIAAGLNGNDGVVVIAGTGSSAFVCGGGGLRRIGGLGYLFDYGGSGYDLGAQGITAALRYEDGTGEKTTIRDKILERTGKSNVLDSLGEFYLKGKREIASYAPVVLECYDDGDAVAERIVKINAEHIVMLIRAAEKSLEGDVDVVFAGGLTKRFDVFLPLIEKGLKDGGNGRKYTLKILQGDVVEGALYLARRTGV